MDDTRATGFGGVRRWPTPHSRTWMSEFLESVARDRNAIAVVAIGSSVRSDVRSEDLNVVVLCSNWTAFTTHAPIEVDLRASTPRPSVRRSGGATTFSLG